MKRGNKELSLIDFINDIPNISPKNIYEQLNSLGYIGQSTAFSILSKFKDADEIYSYLKDSDKYKVFLCKGIAGWHRL